MISANTGLPSDRAAAGGRVSALWYEIPQRPVSSAEVRAVSLENVAPERRDEFLRLLDTAVAELTPNSRKTPEETPKIKYHREAGIVMITAASNNIDRFTGLATALRSAMESA